MKSFFEICVIRERKIVFQSSLRECHPKHSVLIVKVIASPEESQMFMVVGRRVHPELVEGSILSLSKGPS